MSVFNDFQQVWLQRFPESPLPNTWEEHIQQNLVKHREKLELIRTELKKEEIYVEYLERLLQDIQKQITNHVDEQVEPTSNDIQICELPGSENVDTNACLLAKDQLESISNMCITEISNELSKIQPNSNDTNADTINPSDSDAFVTVIEVGGLKSQKEVGDATTAVNAKDTEHYYDIVEHMELCSHDEIPEEISVVPHKSRLSGSANYVNIEYFIQSNVPLEPEHSSSEDDDVQDAVSNDSCASLSSIDSNSQLPRPKCPLPDPPLKRNADEPMYIRILLDVIESETDYVEWLGILIKYMKAIQVTVNTSQPIATELEINTVFYIIPELCALHTDFLKHLKTSVQHLKSSTHPINDAVIHCRVGEAFRTVAQNLELYGAFLSNYGRAVDTVRKCRESNAQFNTITKNITCKHLSKQPVNLDDILHKPVARVQKHALVLHELIKSIENTHPDYHILVEASEITQTFLDQFNMIQTKSMFPVSDRAQRRLVKNSFIVELTDGHRKLRHLFLFNDVIACAKYKSSGRTDKYTFELKWFILVEDICVLEELSTVNVNILNSDSNTVPNIVTLKSQASNVRDQLRQEDLKRMPYRFHDTNNTSSAYVADIQSHHGSDLNLLNRRSAYTVNGGGVGSAVAGGVVTGGAASRGSEKYRKRLMELESQLVLVAPNLPFRLKNRQSTKAYTFYLSSEYERVQWFEAILTLQKTGRPPMPATHVTMFELQTWITACRAFLKTNMGSYLLRSVHDESLLLGDLYVNISELQINAEYLNSQLYIVLEADFYGHFFQKAKTKPMHCNGGKENGCNEHTKPALVKWNENFVIDLEGCENLRILIYQTGNTDKVSSIDVTPSSSVSTILNSCDSLVGKFTQKLSRTWLKDTEMIEKVININGMTLSVSLKYAPSETSLRRVPLGKIGALFGEKIQHVCKKQKRDIPFIVTACIREVERRGMSEVGIYRVSGSASDISKLKKSFETNSYEAEQLLKEVDIHSVTGILKLYLRELPEALFSDQLYPSLLEAFHQSNGNLSKRIDLLKSCFAKLPPQNKATIECILDHLIRVHQRENENKMSLHNLATVFGPTLLRPGGSGKNDSDKINKSNLASGTVDVMAQAGILYAFLQDLQVKSSIPSK